MKESGKDVVVEQGRQAYREGKPLKDNPHTFGSSEFNDFERGWTQELKRDDSPSRHGIEYSRFQREPNAPRFSGTGDAYEDPEEKRKREARAYAKAKGRS